MRAVTRPVEDISIARGIVGPVYGDVFRALRALGPLTPAAFAVLLAQQAIIDDRIGPMRLADGSFQAWAADVALTRLLVPFQVAVFDFARRGRRPFLDQLSANGVGTLRYAAYYMLTSCKVLTLYAANFDRANPGATVPILMGVTAPLWWIQVRLFVVGPVLALGDLQVGWWDAVRAARGKFWAITSAWLQVTGLDLLSTTLIHFIIFDLAIRLKLRSDPIDGVMICARVCLSLIINPILEMTIYMRLGLSLDERGST